MASAQVNNASRNLRDSLQLGQKEKYLNLSLQYRSRYNLIIINPSYSTSIGKKSEIEIGLLYEKYNYTIGFFGVSTGYVNNTKMYGLTFNYDYRLKYYFKEKMKLSAEVYVNFYYSTVALTHSQIAIDSINLKPLYGIRIPAGFSIQFKVSSNINLRTKVLLGWGYSAVEKKYESEMRHIDEFLHIDRLGGYVELINLWGLQLKF
jgi:hypothetical protein